jgi:hypothetical protein
MLQLPDCWEDLSAREKVFTFGVLSELFTGAIEPDVARIRMLIHYTGYRPSAWKLMKEAAAGNAGDRENINFNLFRLSEELTFAFTVEENRIIPIFYFKTNPFPFLRIGTKKYAGKKFDIDVTVRTNITAREFVDCFDILAAQRHCTNEADRIRCTNQICAILYPKNSDAKKNVVSGHEKSMERVPFSIRFAVVCWFIGIVQFYQEHPVYSVLFRRNHADDDADKIRIGMNEIALMLQKEGFGDPYTMNLNDYFDAQVKALKDSINSALAKGAKHVDIANRCNIPLDVVIKLS